jgi:hypothetical protein
VLTVRAAYSLQTFSPYRCWNLVEAGHRAVRIGEAQQLSSADSANDTTGRRIIRCSHERENGARAPLVVSDGRKGSHHRAPSQPVITVQVRSTTFSHVVGSVYPWSQATHSTFAIAHAMA